MSSTAAAQRSGVTCSASERLTTRDRRTLLRRERLCPLHCVGQPLDVERLDDAAVLPVAHERIRGSHACGADAAQTGRGRLVNDDAPRFERARQDEERCVAHLAGQIRCTDEPSELNAGLAAE